MPDLELELFEKTDLKGALILVAFPTTGSAASIAAHYLVEHLNLPLVGHVRVGELSNIIAIQRGKATSVVRVFGGEVQCKLDESCPRIYLVTTELALPPSVLSRLGEAVLAWAKQGGAHLVLVLEGVVRGEGDDIPDVFCAASDPKVLKELRATGVPPMERALIAGITGRILLLAPQAGVRAGSVLVEATRDHPDGRAAVALIEALAKVMPDVAMDPKPLLEEALRLEDEIKRAQEPTELGRPVPMGSFI